ncbi:MAG TPA: hypothetical protein VFK16_11325 [Gemmatimonadaceae bacterium]|nr:hypothetical protein [Gemmatimonadaceae bacterium]
MMLNTLRARWAVAACAIVGGGLLLSSCQWRDQLLEPQNPGLIDPSAVQTPAAAMAVKVGAMGQFRKLYAGCPGEECLWQESGVLADEYKNSDFQNTRQDIDQRTITSNNPTLDYFAITQLRGYLRDGIAVMQQLLPDSTADIGELYMALGFVEMSLAENYCNGIPLGHTINGEVTLGPPLMDAQVFDSASAHLDTALALTTGADADNVFIHRAALIAKARALIDLGQYAQAAALVSTSAVPSAYQYVMATDPADNNDDNGIWVLNNQIARITVSDSFDIIGGVPTTTTNALPFASARDPRVPVASGDSVNPTVAPEDGSTPQFVQLLWGRDDPIPLVSGIDARLIEAEAALNTPNIGAMMTILNGLRAAPPAIGDYQPAPMAALPTPGTVAEARTLFFREKAFWTFGRGQRLSDLRRLIRQYGLTQDQVFPTGAYFKGGVYGTDVNFPVDDSERSNPQFQGCIDRNA